MDKQIMKMIDKAIVRNHPDIIKLMGCIDGSFTDYKFWTYLFSVNKQIRWKKYLEVKKEVDGILKFVGEYDNISVNVNFVVEDKNICYRYDSSGIKRKWTYDKETLLNK
jgi:hypothetical protein